MADNDQQNVRSNGHGRQAAPQGNRGRMPGEFPLDYVYVEESESGSEYSYSTCCCSSCCHSCCECGDENDCPCCNAEREEGQFHGGDADGVGEGMRRVAFCNVGDAGDRDTRHPHHGQGRAHNRNTPQPSSSHQRQGHNNPRRHPGESGSSTRPHNSNNNVSSARINDEIHQTIQGLINSITERINRRQEATRQIDHWTRVLDETDGEEQRVRQQAAMELARRSDATARTAVAAVAAESRAAAGGVPAASATGSRTRLQEIELREARRRYYQEAILAAQRGGGEDHFMSGARSVSGSTRRRQP